MDSVKSADAEIKKVFGNNLNSLRRKAGLSRAEFAEKFNVSVESVGGYERGIRIPALPNLFAMADFFNVSVDELLGREDYTPSRQNAVEEYRLNQAIKQLSTVCKVIEYKRGEFVLGIPKSEDKFVTDSDGIVRYIKADNDLIYFGGASDLIKFAENVMQTALDSDKTFKEIFNEKAENLFLFPRANKTGEGMVKEIPRQKYEEGVIN